MPPNEPAPTAPFTDEDREHLSQMASRLHRYAGTQDRSGEAIDRALSRITHLEGALEDARAERDEANIQRWSIEDGVIGPYNERLETENAGLRKALEAADELARVTGLQTAPTPRPGTSEVQRRRALNVYESTRAALPTSKEDAG